MINWPVKTRDIHNSVFDSSVWNAFPIRTGDIIVASWAKSGTAWTQQIVAQLVFEGREGIRLAEISPWLDFVMEPLDETLATLEAQSHRRIIKTHLPLDALTFSPLAQYLYVARDGRDVVWSMYNHHVSYTDEYYTRIHNAPRRGPEPGPVFEPTTKDVVSYFREWLERDGYPWYPFWENVRTWWEARFLPNVRLVHFAQLKRDLPGEMRRIAAFLGIAIDERVWAAMVEHCTFDYMKAHAEYAAPLGGALWRGGAGSFIYKGTNGRWRDLLSSDDIRAYEERARRELGDAGARWLATGELEPR
jgi:aryl sulfotransferase